MTCVRYKSFDVRPIKKKKVSRLKQLETFARLMTEEQKATVKLWHKDIIKLLKAMKERDEYKYKYEELKQKVEGR